MRKLLLALFLLVFLALLSPLILGFFFTDTSPIDDRDLLYEQETIAPLDNAYFYLKTLKKNLVLEDSDADKISAHLVGEEWDQIFVNNILTDNEAALIAFDAASKSPAYQEPAFADFSTLTIEAFIPTVTSIPAAARLSALEALDLAKANESEAAFEELFKIMNIGKTLGEAQGPLIQKLIALTTQKIALEIMLQLPANADAALRLSEYNAVDAITQGVKGEYFFDSWAVDNLSEVNATEFGLETLPDFLLKLVSDFYFHPNRTKQRFADYARQSLSLLEEPCTDEGEADSIEFLEGRPIYIRYFTANSLGESLWEALAFNRTGIKNKSCEFEALLESTKAALTPL